MSYDNQLSDAEAAAWKQQWEANKVAGIRLAKDIPPPAVASTPIPSPVSRLFEVLVLAKWPQFFENVSDNPDRRFWLEELATSSEFVEQINILLGNVARNYQHLKPEFKHQIMPDEITGTDLAEDFLTNRRRKKQ